MKKYVSTTNACKMCTPMGSCLAFKGIEGAMPFLHGSQGCSTYMRRYIISHFKEPIDIASSSLGEKHAIYGGAANLKQGLKNVTEKYNPALIGIGTTCLTETIGDNTPMFIDEYRKEHGAEPLPIMIPVSTPSYKGTHIDGFHNAVKAVVSALAEGGPRGKSVNILPGFVSPADLRYLKEILEDFQLKATLLPDISETLDGPIVEEYQKLPPGGTPINAIKSMGSAQGTIQLGLTLPDSQMAGIWLKERFAVPCYHLGLPIGVRQTDEFFNLLEKLSSRKMPQKYELERGRLIDSFVDAHKYISGLKAVVYGEEDLVAGLAAFLSEVGITPLLCASGGKSGRLPQVIRRFVPQLPQQSIIKNGMDFMEIQEEAEKIKPDLIVGNSKGFHLAKKLNVPLVRVGFPIHDRIGGQRILHFGYRGAQSLFDTIVNAVIEQKQERSSVGYFYM